MVPGCRESNFTPWQSRSNPDSSPRGPNPSNFRTSWIFGILNLRTFFEDFDPLWPLQRSYCLENVLNLTRFFMCSSKSVQNNVFISQSPPFYENPVSSIRPSEAKTGRCLCVHPHSGGVVDFSIIGFSSMTPRVCERICQTVNSETVKVKTVWDNRQLW